MKSSVLVVSERAETARDLADALTPFHVSTTHVSSVGEASSRIRHAHFRVILTETALADGTWKDLLQLCNGLSEAPMVVVASMHADARLWVDAIDAGAADVLRLPLEQPEARRVVGGAFRQAAAGVAG